MQATSRYSVVPGVCYSVFQKKFTNNLNGTGRPEKKTRRAESERLVTAACPIRSLSADDDSCQQCRRARESLRTGSLVTVASASGCQWARTGPSVGLPVPLRGSESH